MTRQAATYPMTGAAAVWRIVVPTSRICSGQIMFPHKRSFFYSRLTA